MRKISIVLAFSILFASVLLIPHAKADVGSIPYDNIGTEWNTNPFLVKDISSWDCRTWQWDTNYLEISHGNEDNCVHWDSDGQVNSGARDGAGDAVLWKASNFDQGYEKYQDEISNLADWGGWDNKADSLRVEGAVTLYDGIGYTGNSITLTTDTPNLGTYAWDNKVCSLNLSRGSRVTLYNQQSFSGDCVSFVYPTYQPPGLKVSDKNTITLEGVVSNWHTDTWTSPGWTGAKFDIFAVENRSSNFGKVLMLEMYFLRDGMNLAWNTLNLFPGCSGNYREGFRGPPFQQTYNYLVAIDAFPELVETTAYSGNVVKWKIDVKSFIQNACDHWPELDIDKLSIVKICFTVEAAWNFPLTFNPAAGCNLHRLRLAYTPAPTVYLENAYNKPQSGSSWSKTPDSSSPSGYVMKAPTSSANGGCLFGPYIISGLNGEIMLGKPYKATFRLRTTNNIASDDIARIDVCYNAGTIIQSMTIKANGFTSSSWQDLQLTFVSPNSITAGLEFRIINLNNGVADIFADWIVVQKECDSSTCYIEAAYNKQQSGDSWYRIDDQSSYSGLVMKAQATSPNGGCLFGPYITTDWSGQTMLGKPFNITFRLKASSIFSSNDLVNVDICYDAGTVLQSVVIKANDFAAPNTWQDFNTSFIVPKSVTHGLEFRVKNLNNGLADIYLDCISADRQWNTSTVYFEAAYSKQITGSSWSKVIDSSSFSGTVLKASASSSNGTWLYGPYINRDLQEESMLGKPYIVSLMLKISSNLLQNNVAYIDVCCNAGKAIQSRTIKANDFAMPNAWQEFQLNFIAPNTMTAGLEFRIENLNNGIADLCVDYISVSPRWNASTAYAEGAYNKQQFGSSWSTVNDPSSWSGIVMKATASSVNSGCLYGPYISSDWDAKNMLGRSYTATFTLKVSSNLTTDNVVRVDVCYNAGSVLQLMIIKANDFASPNTWQDFRLAFTTPGYLTYGLEFRVTNLSNDITDLFADQISVNSIE